MNITFLIGNGFDIGLGMNSRFKDFFHTYKIQSLGKDESIKQLSQSIENNYEKWADFEKALGEYTSQFNLKNANNLVDQVMDFERSFMNYLKCQEESLSFENSDQIASIMTNALKNYFSSDNLAIESTNLVKKTYDRHSNENHRYNFINFNYTFLLTKALQTIPDGIISKHMNGDVKKVDKIGKMVHVHGTRDDAPIMGVNDETQIANKEIAEDPRLSRYIVKPLMNRYLRKGADSEATDMINTSTIICVYGMSLGETDKKWWNMILQWLAANTERQFVIFDYDEKYDRSTPYNWFEKEDYMMDKLAKYNSNSNINVEKLRSRIHIAVNKNIFHINLPVDFTMKYTEYLKTASV